MDIQTRSDRHLHGSERHLHIDYFPHEIKEMIMLSGDNPLESLCSFSVLNHNWEKMAQNTLLLCSSDSIFIEFYKAPYETVKRLYDKTRFLKKLRQSPRLAYKVIETALNVILDQNINDPRLKDILMDQEITSQLTAEEKAEIQRQLDEKFYVAEDYGTEKAVSLFLLGSNNCSPFHSTFVTDAFYIRILEQALLENRTERMEHLAHCFDSEDFTIFSFLTFVAQSMNKAAAEGRLDLLVAMAPFFRLRKRATFLQQEFIASQKCQYWSMWKEAFENIPNNALIESIFSSALHFSSIPEYEECVSLTDALLKDYSTDPSQFHHIYSMSPLLDSAWDQFKLLTAVQVAQGFDEANHRRTSTLEDDTLELYLRRGNEFIDWSRKHPILNEWVHSLLYCERGQIHRFNRHWSEPMMRNCIRIAMMRNVNQDNLRNLVMDSEWSGLITAMSLQNQRWTQILLPMVLREPMHWMRSVTHFGAHYYDITALFTFVLSQYSYQNEVLEYLQKNKFFSTLERVQMVVKGLLQNHQFDLFLKLLPLFSPYFPLPIEMLTLRSISVESLERSAYHSLLPKHFEFGLIDVALMTVLMSLDAHQIQYSTNLLLSDAVHALKIDFALSLLLGEWQGSEQDQEYIALDKVAKAVQPPRNVNQVLQELRDHLSIHSAVTLDLLEMVYYRTNQSQILQLLPFNAHELIVMNLMQHAIKLNSMNDVDFLFHRCHRFSLSTMQEFLRVARNHGHREIYLYFKSKMTFIFHET